MTGSVADDAVAEELVSTCVEHYGGVDVVVNNAGIVRDRTLLNMTTDDFDQVIAVNLRGTWSVCRHAARVMKDAGGLFLHVISGSAFLGSVGQSNYAASKAGMLPEEIAKAVVHLCSDAAAQLRNQIVLFNGRKLSTFTHIHESASEVADCWSVAEIGRALAGSAESVYSFRGGI